MSETRGGIDLMEVRAKEVPVSEDEAELEALMNKVNAENEAYMRRLAEEHEANIREFIETRLPLLP